MRVGIIYSGVGGANGADYVADMLRNGFRDICIEPEMIGGFGCGNPAMQGLNGRFDLLIHSSGYNLTPARVENIKAHGPLALWSFNCEMPMWQDILTPITEAVDFHYSYSKEHPWGDHVEYMPLAADKRIYYPTQPIYTDEGRDYEVALIGSRRAWRCAFMDIMSARFKTFCGWSMVLGSDQINDIYNRTKVIVAPVQDCDEDQPAAAWGCPCRTFDVPAARTMQVQVRRGGVEDVYPHAVTLPAVQDVKEAADMWIDCIERWIADPEARKAQAESDYQRTINANLYQHRAAQFVEGVTK